MEGELKWIIGDGLEKLRWTHSVKTWLTDQCVYFLSFGARRVSNGVGWRKKYYPLESLIMFTLLLLGVLWWNIFGKTNILNSMKIWIG